MKFKNYIKLRNEYNRLPIEERLRRAEFLANYYLGLVTQEADLVVDATKNWPQFAEMQRQSAAIEGGAVTLAEAMQ
jgi:hypothetical protein